MDLTILMLSASATSPKTTCLPSSQLVTTVVMKNWEPLLFWKEVAVSVGLCKIAAVGKGRADVRAYVFGPALAIDKSPGLVCLRSKFSSANFSP